MGTVITSTSGAATGFGNQRKIDRCQNGVLWTVMATADRRLGAAYSTDNGATWTSVGNIGAIDGSYFPSAAFFIEPDDYAHLAYKDTSDGYIKYQRGTPNTARTAYTWSAATVIESGSTTADYPDLVAHREGSGWAVHVVYGSTDNNTLKAFYKRLDITSGGAVTANTRVSVSAAIGSANSNPGYPSIDFNHTGDGKTVAGGTPHLYVGWSAGATGSGYGIRFRKATYASGAWTWGTEREIDNAGFVSSNRYWLACLFDGSRVILGGLLDSGATIRVVAHERDAADTSTTTRNLISPADSANVLVSGSLSYDSLGNLYLFGRSSDGAGAGSYSVRYRRWTRATATLETPTVFDATGNADPYISARRGPQGQAIDYVYTDGTASPYTVTSGRITLNQNPTAPTPQTPADNATWDSSTDQTVTLGYSDPDGNPASKVRVYYRPKGTSAPFAVIEQNTTAASGTNVNTTIPAGTWPGEIQWYGQAADSSGAWSDPGPLRTVTGIPTALAALTGGGGGTAFSAWTISNATENARAVRIAGRTALATIASVSPLTITVEGSTLSATRSAGYTPAQGDTVQADYVSGGWIVQDKIVQ